MPRMVEQSVSLMDAAVHNVPACMDSPRAHRAKHHSADPVERLDGGIKRRTDAVGVFPDEAAIARRIGAVLLEQSDGWATHRARCMTLETVASVSDTPAASLPAVAA